MPTSQSDSRLEDIYRELRQALIVPEHGWVTGAISFHERASNALES
jgi:hypothetical protein